MNLLGCCKLSSSIGPFEATEDVVGLSQTGQVAAMLLPQYSSVQSEKGMGEA